MTFAFICTSATNSIIVAQPAVDSTFVQLCFFSLTVTKWKRKVVVTPARCAHKFILELDKIPNF